MSLTQPSQYATHVQCGRGQGCPRSRGRARGQNQQPHGITSFNDDPLHNNINQPISQVNPQTPDDDPFWVDPQPAGAGPSHVIHPAHIIGGALADPQVDGLNRGHIAHCDSAAS